MNLSKREQTMILSLGLFGIGIMYYQFGYQYLASKVSEKTGAENQIEENYNKSMEAVNALEVQKSRVKVLNTKISQEASPLYPIISQENIILELDKLLKESGLEAGLSFTDEEMKAVEAVKKSEKDKDLGQSSLQKIVDDFNNKYGIAKKDLAGNSTNSTSAAQGNQVSTASSSKDSKNNSGNTVGQLKLNVDFNGSYESVNNFLNKLKTYKRKMTVSTITVTEKSINEVSGTISLIAYSIPKIDDDLSSYLKWDLNNTYGKLRPFDVGSAVGTGIKSDKPASDFLIGVNSSFSALPTVIIGKSDDNYRTSYAYADGNNVQEAEIIFTKKADKYYYKYKTNTDKIPANYSDLGNEFVPNGDNVVLNISSESRVKSDDKSGLKLKIVNNTEKLVMVNITGDDTKDPRVTIDGDSKNISVNKK